MGNVLMFQLFIPFVKVSKKTGKGLEACNQRIRLSEKAVMWLQYAVKSFLVGPPQGE